MPSTPNSWRALGGNVWAGHKHRPRGKLCGCDSMHKVNQRTGQRTGDVTRSSGEDRQRMSCRSLLGRLGTRAVRVHRRMVSREALSCCHPIAVCAPTESSLVVCAGSSDAEGIEMPIFPCPTCTLPRTRAWCVWARKLSNNVECQLLTRDDCTCAGHTG